MNTVSAAKIQQPDIVVGCSIVTSANVQCIGGEEVKSARKRERGLSKPRQSNFDSKQLNSWPKLTI